MAKISAPNFTQIPNILLDNIHDLSLSELKVMLAICRKTFGWQKTISILSISELSKLTGLSQSSVKLGLADLLKKEWVERKAAGQTFEYSVNVEMIGEPSRNSATHPAEIQPGAQPNSDHEPSRNSATHPAEIQPPLYKEKKKETLNKEEPLRLSLSLEGEGACSPPVNGGLAEEIVAFWNSIGKLPKIQALNAARKHLLTVRSKDKFWATNWRSAIDRISKSDFCTGRNDRGWMATIDWLLQPNTVVKVMEGKYDNRTTVGANTRQNSAAVRNGQIIGSESTRAAIRADQARREPTPWQRDKEARGAATIIRNG